MGRRPASVSSVFEGRAVRIRLVFPAPCSRPVLSSDFHDGHHGQIRLERPGPVPFGFLPDTGPDLRAAGRTGRRVRRLQINPQVILRGLGRHWWRILLLWLVVSTPLAYLILR